MPPSTPSRRGFLAASAGAAVAATLGWPDLAGAARPATSTALSALLVSNDLYVSPTPQRVAFVIYRGPNPDSGATARLGLAPPGAGQGEIVTAVKMATGLPKGRGVYVVDAVLDQAGTYQGEVLYQGHRLPLALQVKTTADAPVPGDAASHAPSPTKANPLGVNPICTRQPPCSLHAVSLSDVVGAGKPVAALFATPALCQTRYCGPVLNELLAASAPFQNEISFVHVEIYQSLTGTQEAPTVLAWGIPYEPFFFTIDDTGVIRGRLDSAFGRDEITPLLQALVPPA
jgi:hypothetical protein